MKKFELTTNTRVKYGRTLVQIRASLSFGFVSKGDLGGWVESEDSIKDDVWVHENAEVFKDAVIRGGEIWGGEIWGGEIRGGVIRGGEIRGGEIRKTSDYIAFCSIGSEYGVLTAYMVKNDIEVTRGCFRGTLKEFEEKVKIKHKNNPIAKEYEVAIKLIKLRFSANVKISRKKKNAK